MADEEKPQFLEPIEPVRITGTACAGGTDGVALLFAKTLFRPGQETVDASKVSAGGVFMGWSAFYELLASMTGIAEQRKAQAERSRAEAEGQKSH